MIRRRVVALIYGALRKGAPASAQFARIRARMRTKHTKKHTQPKRDGEKKRLSKTKRRRGRPVRSSVQPCIGLRVTFSALWVIVQRLRFWSILCTMRHASSILLCSSFRCACVRMLQWVCARALSVCMCSVEDLTRGISLFDRIVLFCADAGFETLNELGFAILNNRFVWIEIKRHIKQSLYGLRFNFYTENIGVPGLPFRYQGTYSLENISRRKLSFKIHMLR